MKKTIGIGILVILSSALLIYGLFFLLSIYSDYNDPRANIDLSTINSYDDCVLAGFSSLETFPEQCQTPEGRIFINSSSEHASSDVLMSGTFVCLPSNDLGLAHDDMCAYGLLAEDGAYYGLREAEDSEALLWELKAGDEIVIEGVFLPGMDIRYESLGTIEVENIELISE